MVSQTEQKSTNPWIILAFWHFGMVLFIMILRTFMIFICNSLNGELGTNRRFIAGSYSKIKLD
jgi:hypothetical protein